MVENSVLGTFVLPVAKALRLQGAEPLDLMERVGIDPAHSARPDWRVPTSQMHALMRASVVETEDEFFGLSAAEQLQPQVLHGLGLAWLASDTVYDGLRRLVRFGRLMSSGADLSLQEDGELVHLQLHGNADTDDFAYAVRDYAVGIILRMCKLTLGEFIAPVEVAMARPEPADPTRWEYMLATKVSFNASMTRITWYRADIEDPLVTGDPALARVNDEQAQSYLDSFLAQSVSRIVVDKIIERLPDGPPNQQRIAADMNVSHRTLQRKLKEEGASFADLLKDTRLQLARKYLQQTNRSVVETAYLLGFSEPSTFSRAFKRWTGQAPAEYRDAIK
ncbi:MAG: AraC family transcriptional regulator [Halioglobus sp.]